MLVSGFELNEPLPELNAPHALVTVRPWINVGDVGTLALTRLEKIFRAEELGKLARPGNFFDFTRYRPIICTKKGFPEVVIPNSSVTFAKRQGENDLVFLHLLEPHTFAEAYVDSVLDLLKVLKVEKYCLIGSMYDAVPHTRQLLVSGGGAGEGSVQNLEKVEVYRNFYHGLTTICYLISQGVAKTGVETSSLIVHLPEYTELEEDYVGMVAVLQELGRTYRFTVDESDTFTAESQLKDIDSAVERDPRLKSIVSELEKHYDARIAVQEKEEKPQFSPDVEKFLQQMENKFRENRQP